LPARLEVSLPRQGEKSNSLAFVDGVPIFERFFLGDEFTIRGYNVRSITPLLRSIHLSLQKTS
jgi:outer membrane protein assembly factor BamA